MNKNQIDTIIEVLKRGGTVKFNGDPLQKIEHRSKGYYGIGKYSSGYLENHPFSLINIKEK